ncbi:hypothetical protein GQ55_7G211000 [Panicum hallii var. hallii]|uniref:Uncharacterized protein n=1 Tax=Panicum hallii var. hallii TaxID=1504633 RepID=A0A2T7CXD4_9POAL|nr:hypothetical protein GQ55_7G211000 [Panicum hallii var. hallii]
MLLFPFIMATWDSPRHDAYSPALTAADGFVQPAGGGAPSLSPEFNFTLYAANDRLTAGSCFSHGRVAVSYGGVAVGEGRVPGWCAGPRKHGGGRRGSAGRGRAAARWPEAAPGDRAALGGRGVRRGS